jgi:hypothetical protein
LFVRQCCVPIKHCSFVTVEHHSTHCCSFGNQNMYYFKAARYTFKKQSVSSLRVFFCQTALKSVSTYSHCILYRCTKHWLRNFFPSARGIPTWKNIGNPNARNALILKYSAGVGTCYPPPPPPLWSDIKTSTVRFSLFVHIVCFNSDYFFV